MAQLTIPDEVTSQTYTVTSAQSAFPFAFAVFTKADLHFAVAGVELPQSAFTLSGTLLEGGGFQGGTVNLVTPISATTALLWRETVAVRSTNYSPSPSVPVRDLDVALNRLTAMVQDLKRDLIAGGLGVGSAGVASVNGHSGIVTLTAADFGAMPTTGGAFSGPISGVTAPPGDNTTLYATTAWTTTAIAALGGGVTLATTGTPADLGVAARGVGTTAARSDHVHNLPTLTALGAAPAVVTAKGDLYTFGAAPLRLSVGANAQILTADGTQTAGLKWVNLDWSIVLGKPSVFPPSAHTHIYSDITNFGAGVNASLAAGTGVILGLSGGITTISATGGLAYQYVPAWENGITTSTAASTNTSLLNSLIATLNASGGGTIWFNAPGPYQINGTITLRSNVSIRMTSGALFSWVGSSSGTIFQTDSTTVLNGCHHDLFVNEGGAFGGVVLRMHSAYRNTWNLVGFGTQIATGKFMYLSADSSGTGPFVDANLAFNTVRAIHIGTCGYFFQMDGLASGVNGNPQVCTLNNFVDFQAVNCLFRGIKIDTWSDTNLFSGQTRLNIVGANSIGVILNEGHTSNFSVYNIHFDHLAPDTFGTGLSRYGVVLQESWGISCDSFYQSPIAELGDLIGTNCTSYQFRWKNQATDKIRSREKGIEAATI